MAFRRISSLRQTVYGFSQNRVLCSNPKFHRFLCCEKNIFDKNRYSAEAITLTNRRISTAKHSNGNLGKNQELLTFGEGDGTKLFNKKWLRENCRCHECFNQDTEQRNVLYYELHTKQYAVSSSIFDGQYLQVVWEDGHVSKYDVKWLFKNSYPGVPSAEQTKLWTGDSAPGIDVVPHEIFMKTPNGLSRLLTSLLQYGIGMVANVPATVEHTQKVVERVCFIQRTLYGSMWDFTADMARADTAYTNLSLGAHTDTTYLSLPAGIQVFHCLNHDGEGGETQLVDGYHAAEQLRETDHEAFKMLCNYRIHHENKDRDAHHVRSLVPVIQTHPVTGEVEIIRYNHYDRCPISTIPQELIEDYYGALQSFSHQIINPKNEFWIKLNPGNVLFINNWRVLHGRAAFTGSRTMCGCYLPGDDWIGRARIMDIIH